MHCSDNLLFVSQKRLLLSREQPLQRVSLFIRCRRVGSSSGIGKAVALAFATQNAQSSQPSTKICVMSRSQTRLQKVVDEIEALGAQGFAVAGDLTNGRDCQAAVQEAVSHISRFAA